MNAKTTVILIAAGVFSTGCYAADTSAVATTSPAASEKPAIASNDNDVRTPRQFTVDQVIRSEYRYGGSYAANADPDSPFSVRHSRDADPFPIEIAPRRVVLGVTAAPIIGGDPDGPTTYYPSVTFRFDFGRDYHS